LHGWKERYLSVLPVVIYVLESAPDEPIKLRAIKAYLLGLQDSRLVGFSLSLQVYRDLYFKARVIWMAKAESRVDSQMRTDYESSYNL
jgi:hypothetical protein